MNYMCSHTTVSVYYDILSDIDTIQISAFLLSKKLKYIYLQQIYDMINVDDH